MDGDPLVAPARLEPSPELRVGGHAARHHDVTHTAALGGGQRFLHQDVHDGLLEPSRQDRKSTRLNSSHSQISYAVFCLKKKKKQRIKSQDTAITTAHRPGLDPAQAASM